MGYILDTINNTVYFEGDSYNGGILKYIKNIGADVGEPEFLIQVQRLDVVNSANSLLVTPTAEILDDFIAWNSPNPREIVIDCNVNIPLVVSPDFANGDFTLITDPLGDKVRIRFAKANPDLVLLFCSEYTGGFLRTQQGYVDTSTLTFVSVTPIGGYYFVDVKKNTLRTVEEVYIKQQACVNYQFHNYYTNWWGSVPPPEGDSSDPRKPFTPETTERRINFNQFDTQAPVEGVFTCLGYGTPLYGNEALEIKTNRVSPLLSGISNFYTNGMKRKYENTPQYYKVGEKDPNGYYFQQLLKMVLDWGRIASSSEYGDTSGILNQNSGSPEAQWYWPAGITAAGWRQIGAQIGANSQHVDGNNSETKWLMMDDESGQIEGAGQLTWAGRAQAVKWICEGINAIAPNIRAMYYGAVPVTSFSGTVLAGSPYPYVNDGGVLRYDRSQYFTLSEAAIQTQLLTGSPNMGISIGRCASDYTSYVGYPWIKTHPKYNKVSNAFVLNSSGYRRYYDGQDRNESINGYNVVLKTSQDAQMAVWYGAVPITGAQHYVDSVYRFANTLIERICVMNRFEKGSFDMWNNNVWGVGANSKDRRNVIGGVIRPMTENTKYSHYIAPQLCGDDFIEYFTWFSLLSGVTMLEIWEDDYVQEYAENPSSYTLTSRVGCMNDTKHLKYVQCVSDFHRTFQDSDRANWKFVRFYYPYVGELRREHIATGIYDGTKLCLFVTGPTLETGATVEERETCNITFKFGAMTVVEIIRGGENLVRVYTGLESGLIDTQFTMEYTNIYGVAIKVNGKLGEKVQHYLLNP